jgi:hypothetical protein
MKIPTLHFWITVGFFALSLPTIASAAISGSVGNITEYQSIGGGLGVTITSGRARITSYKGGSGISSLECTTGQCFFDFAPESTRAGVSSGPGSSAIGSIYATFGGNWDSFILDDEAGHSTSAFTVLECSGIIGLYPTGSTCPSSGGGGSTTLTTCGIASTSPCYIDFTQIGFIAAWFLMLACFITFVWLIRKHR